MREKKVEVLAPAGSYDILTAVLAAGADAVYLGGTMFGARAYANNFNREELLRALDYAHLQDKKIYLTVNTLMKETELQDRLTEYLIPFYEAGLDAVIVQDFGAFQTIRKNFPGLAIHASTQMTATGVESAKLLEKMGATRVVTARELNLAEIREIKNNCSVEIESFVHGALCYCYSGQCLLSSFNGARSGNRGRCAQPCRLAYDVDDKEQTGYVLSPKDMCGLTILPDIIEAGVYSLKIEGRMKNVNYAAGVTSAYRKYVDLYLEQGRAGYHVEESDINDLMDLYNRGAFTTGYYNNTKGRKMISMLRPNHMGTKALKVVSNAGGRVTFQALEPIYPQDVFEIDRDNSFESGESYSTGKQFVVNLPKRYRLEKGKVLYRMKNGELTRNITARFANKKLKKKIAAYLTAVVGEPLKLVVTDPATGISVCQTAEAVQAAVKQPAVKEKLAAQIAAMGDTPFEAELVEVELKNDAFIPVGKLKELRRSCLEELELRIQSSYRRSYHENTVVTENQKKALQQKAGQKPQVTMLVTSMQQAENIYSIQEVSAIYYDFRLFLKQETGGKRVAECVNRCRETQKECVIVLPHILREKNAAVIKNLIQECLIAGADTFLVRGLEELGLLVSFCEEKTFQGRIKVIADANMYTWNSAALAFLKEMCQNVELLRTTYPLEQTAEEMILGELPRELVVYTRIPLMVSEQCVKKTLGTCDGKEKRIQIQANHTPYFVQSVCSMCYSVMYDSKIYDISDLKEKIAAVNPDFIRYELVDSEGMQPDLILRDKTNCEKVTRGHFELGVE